MKKENIPAMRGLNVSTLTDECLSESTSLGDINSDIVTLIHRDNKSYPVPKTDIF